MGDMNDENAPFLSLDEFLEDVAEINTNIQSYRENLEKIRELHSKLLMGIGWGQESRKNLSDELETVIKHNKAIEKTVRSKIKNGYSHAFTVENDENIRKEKLESMTTLLMESILEHKNLDIQFKEKSKKKLINAIKITGVKLSEEEIEDKIERDDIESFLNTSIIQETEEAKRQLLEVEDRHEDLKKLEHDIMELTDLYNEMLSLVESQGVTVTNIQQKIDDTQNTIHDTVGLLELTREYMGKAFAKKRLLAVICAAIFLVLLIIIISASVSGASPESDSGAAEQSTSEAPEENFDECDPSVDPDCVG